VSDTRNKREDALILAKKIRDALLDEEKQVSTLLLGCKTVCRYLGILEENMWIGNELNGYDITEFKSLKEQQEGLPEYRTTALVYYDLRNQPLVDMNIEQAELLGASKLPNAIAELETSKQLSLTSGPMLDLINHLTGRSHSHGGQYSNLHAFHYNPMLHLQYNILSHRPVSVHPVRRVQYLVSLPM
jgi:hypothetical protein